MLVDYVGRLLGKLAGYSEGKLPSRNLAPSMGPFGSANLRPADTAELQGSRCHPPSFYHANPQFDCVEFVPVGTPVRRAAAQYHAQLAHG
jgi:hypothetical protein